MNPKKLNIVHFHRKRRKDSNYSIEGFYENVRNTLKDKLNISVINCPYMSNGILRRVLNFIYAAFKQQDINHITGDVNYLNLLMNSKKNILTILDCGLLHYTQGITRSIYKLFWFKLPVDRAKYVVAISESTKTEILKTVKCNPDKIKVIYVSISPIYRRVDKEFNKMKPVLLHIGTSPNKNLTGHIRAIKGLNCKLVIIGKLNEEYINELNTNSVDYDNFVNLTDAQVFEQYQKCDILLFASTYEGFGMPIIEANTVGRPVITSNLLSMPEVAGDAALLVNPYEISEIRDGIIKIINDDNLRNELINSGYENIKRFEIENIAIEYFKLYKELLT